MGKNLTIALLAKKHINMASFRAESVTSLMTEFLHLLGALMEHFLEGISLLKDNWYINPNEMNDKYKSSLPS